MTWGPLVLEALRPVLDDYRRLDCWEQAEQAEQLNAALLKAQKRVAQLRRSAVRELRAEGYTLREIAERLGISPPRVMQIEQGYNRAEKRARKEP